MASGRSLRSSDRCCPFFYQGCASRDVRLDMLPKGMQSISHHTDMLLTGSCYFRRRRRLRLRREPRARARARARMGRSRRRLGTRGRGTRTMPSRTLFKGRGPLHCPLRVCACAAPLRDTTITCSWQPPLGAACCSGGALLSPLPALRCPKRSLPSDPPPPPPLLRPFGPTPHAKRATRTRRSSAPPPSASATASIRGPSPCGSPSRGGPRWSASRTVSTAALRGAGQRRLGGPCSLELLAAPRASESPLLCQTAPYPRSRHMLPAPIRSGCSSFR